MTWSGVQIYGPNVAPLTVGKQNLISYVLRQLEKHFYVVNQFFRLAECSHNIELQQATVTLVIVTHSEITDVGLDTVSSHASCYQHKSYHACIDAMHVFMRALMPCMLLSLPFRFAPVHMYAVCRGVSPQADAML